MKLGCDPELFLVDAAGAFISSIGRIGGSKEQPRPLAIGEGYAVQEDNVALEFNIPAADTAQEFKDNINMAMIYLRSMISSQGLAFSKESATIFPAKQLEHPQALMFGCDPDFNAWTNGKVNPKPKADDWRLRSCGGHVHIGHPLGKEKNVIEFIKWMDLYAGVGSVLMDNGELRKQLYGKAGAYRPKPYGCEYRVLSNYWIHEDRLIDWVWNSTKRAMEAWYSGDQSPLKEDGQYIQDAINNNNKELALYLVDKYDIEVLHA